MFLQRCSKAQPAVAGMQTSKNAGEAKKHRSKNAQDPLDGGLLILWARQGCSLVMTQLHDVLQGRSESHVVKSLMYLWFVFMLPTHVIALHCSFICKRSLTATMA